MFRGMQSQSNALTAQYPKKSYSWIDHSKSYPLEKREASTTATSTNRTLCESKPSWRQREARAPAIIQDRDGEQR